MAKGDSRKKFVELAEKRVVKAIKAIRIVGNLSNKSNYSYTEDDAKQIIKVLENEVKSLRQRFESPTSAEEIQFKLS